MEWSAACYWLGCENSCAATVRSSHRRYPVLTTVHSLDSPVDPTGSLTCRLIRKQQLTFSVRTKPLEAISSGGLDCIILRAGGNGTILTRSTARNRMIVREWTKKFYSICVFLPLFLPIEMRHSWTCFDQFLLVEIRGKRRVIYTYIYRYICMLSTKLLFVYAFAWLVSSQESSGQEVVKGQVEGAVRSTPHPRLEHSPRSINCRGFCP